MVAETLASATALPNAMRNNFISVDLRFVRRE